MTELSLGILTGISYVSGLDYYKGIHERVLANVPKGHLMPPNPTITMVSVDCDVYAHNLTLKKFDQVYAHLLEGVDKLVAAGCNWLVIASNTGHICVPTVETAYPELKILHIADCFAAKLKQRGLKYVGLVGTQPTMEERYLHERLARHGIKTIVPQEEAVRKELYRIIYEELSFDNFQSSSRETMVKAIRALGLQGAEACILGCTEIELLVQQEHVPELLLLPSAEIHIETTAEILLGKIHIDDVLPDERLSPTAGHSSAI